ncbi:MAG: 2-succinyl-5-enolpyruvyl-6-hydroxy-3-cyclohexene-1-carboxylic-acid synthase, partial [Propionibacterium sp.]|nr:2-succinyl-5-enolpyruvyl-6-hydroxy-3-cyclohexene-1-carboxylic-acid synthase [Propionibacterium sp.]
MTSPQLARDIVAGLVAAGVREVVVAPGSRNAPLAIACHRADADGLLRLHVRIDERSGGFVALGLALASRRPVAVMTTSGTAVGNLLPAVMEAAAAGVPLVVVSADRPVRLVGTGANQTTDQDRLFGVHVRGHASLTSSDAPPHAVHAIVQRLVHEASGTRSRRPGPVQLNVQLAPPLVDDHPGPPLPTVRAVTVDRPAGSVTDLDGTPRTVVLAGAADPDTGRRARALAEAAGVPLLAEPSSNARAGSHAIAGYRVLLGRDDLGARIERVLVFGHPTLSRPLSALMARSDLELVVVSGEATWPDPGHRAAVVADDVRIRPCPDPHWLNRWRTADHVLRTRIDLMLDREHETLGPTGLDVAALVTARVGAGQNLVIGSSNPIRDADLAPISADPATVYANRGLAGIDGTVSTASGVALGSGLPTTVLLGDVTAIHDTGGLWLGELERRPKLRVVVLDDGGGAIFHTLEQGGLPHADSFE